MRRTFARAVRACSLSLLARAAAETEEEEGPPGVDEEDDRIAARAAATRVWNRAAEAEAAEAASAAARPRNRTVGRGRGDKSSRRILLAGHEDFVTAQVIDRDGLAPGDTLRGPAIVEQSDTTTVIEPDMTVVVDKNGNLLVKVK